MMPVYRKEIIPVGPRDYDAILNDAYIGSFPSPDLAQAELDRVAYEDARRGGLLADQPFTSPSTEEIDLAPANPLVPFGVPGGPTPDLSGLTTADLCRAAERVADYYERFPLVVRRVLSALDIAILGLEDHQAGKEPANCKWYIADDGTLFAHKSQGGGRYLVNDDMCGCQSYWLSVKGTKYAGQGVSDGKCKHTLAREILRLSQAYRGTWSAEGGNQVANLRVAARPLARALKATAKAAPQLTVGVMFFRLRIVAGNVIKVLDTETDGWGVCAIPISAEDATRLATELWQASKAQPDAAVNLFLDEGAGEIDVLGADNWRFASSIRRAA
jgi:hypothetical protein